MGAFIGVQEVVKNGAMLLGKNSGVVSVLLLCYCDVAE